MRAGREGHDGELRLIFFTYGQGDNFPFSCTAASEFLLYAA